MSERLVHIIVGSRLALRVTAPLKMDKGSTDVNARPLRRPGAINREMGVLNAKKGCIVTSLLGGVVQGVEVHGQGEWRG